MNPSKAVTETGIMRVGSYDDDSGSGEKDRLMGSYEAAYSLPPYATRDLLSKYIPNLDNTKPEETHWQRFAKHVPVLRSLVDTVPKKPGLMEKRTSMLRNQALIAVAAASLNLAVTVWAIVVFPRDSNGVGLFYEGSCRTASAVNSAAHVVLNAISTLFLGAGNYCMQIQVAPSREEMDKAHAKGKTLEIGVPSLKNLWRISGKRVAFWIGLGLIATTLHVFWNAAIFTSLPTVFVSRAVVTSDWRTAGDIWSETDPWPRLEEGRWWDRIQQYRNVTVNATTIYAMQDEAKQYRRISNRECVKTFIEPKNANQALVIVAKDMTRADNPYNSSLLDAGVFGWNADSSWASEWICWAHQYKPEGMFCQWYWMEDFADDWTLYEPPIKVDHCLVGEPADTREKCGLHYSTHVMGIVCGSTFVEFLLILGIYFQQRRAVQTPDDGDEKNGGKTAAEDKRTMITMGDAIHSYLEAPSSKFEADQDHSGEPSGTRKKAEPGTYQLQLKQWCPKESITWFKAVGTGAWIRASTLFILAAAVFSFLIGSSARSASASGIDISPATLWDHGFGVNPALTAGSLGPLDKLGLSPIAAMLWQILITNLPQVIISMQYIFYNSIFTRQLVADEWVRFLDKDGKKVLRVSSPEGMQRSTYFLSLPLKYSLPLMVLSTTLHWLISQSIFLVQTRAFSPGKAERLPQYDNTGRGYSILGSILALLFAGIMVAVMVINSWIRRYRNIPDGFQLMAYNSSGIQAMCQRPEADSDAQYFPVKIGVVNDPARGPDENGRVANGTLAFSTDIRMKEPGLQEDGPEQGQPMWLWQPVLVPPESRLRKLFRRGSGKKAQ